MKVVQTEYGLSSELFWIIQAFDIGERFAGMKDERLGGQVDHRKASRFSVLDTLLIKENGKTQ